MLRIQPINEHALNQISLRNRLVMGLYYSCLLTVIFHQMIQSKGEQITPTEVKLGEFHHVKGRDQKKKVGHNMRRKWLLVRIVLTCLFPSFYLKDKHGTGIIFRKVFHLFSPRFIPPSLSVFLTTKDAIFPPEKHHLKALSSSERHLVLPPCIGEQ